MNPRFPFVLLFLLLTAMPNAEAQYIQEIPAPQLPDIAMASFDYYGRPVIYYNPVIVSQVHPVVRRFFYLHEVGHHSLGHIRREMFEANQWNRAWSRQNYEKESDCFAARSMSPQERQFISEFFVRTQGPTRPDWLHPTGYERAVVVAQC
jgi:hypothetical protein